MYTPANYAETRTDVLHALVAAHPLGTLVTQGADGLAADHVPFEIGAPTPDAPLGVLRAHVARGNPLWRLAESNVLVVFQGPAAYVSPALFEEKAISGKVVPTWDYAVVHAHGPLRAVDDTSWLLALLTRLTDRHEAARAAPWAVADAPAAYVEALMQAIVGIEIPIARLEGKWKINQTNPPGDRERIADSLLAAPGSTALGLLMRERLDEGR